MSFPDHLRQMMGDPVGIEFARAAFEGLDMKVTVDTTSAAPWLKVHGDGVWLSVETRPTYCDRGRFRVLAQPEPPYAVTVDVQDGFPRYYFGVDAMATEIEAWLRAKKAMLYTAESG